MKIRTNVFVALKKDGPLRLKLISFLAILKEKAQLQPTRVADAQS